MAYDKEKSESYQLLGGINTKASPYLNDEHEFRDISNLGFVVLGSLTKRSGSTQYTGATVAGKITGLFEFERLSGASYLVATANTNAYTVTPSGFTAFKTNLLNNAIFDFVTFVDRLFASNGQDFFKFDGTNSTKYSLPAGATGWGATAAAPGGLSGIFLASWGYINERGYVGPAADGMTVICAGNKITYYGLTSPSGFGITAIQLYRSIADGEDLFGTTTIPFASTTFDDDSDLTTLVGNDNLFFTLAPQFLELYNNQLFLGGFSSQPSTVYWSQVGEPEGIDPTFNAEFRTNDGDRITGLKSYNGSLVVTKERSFHRITGEDPSNFQLVEISDQYGCLSNRALVTYRNSLLMLDIQGILEYDGSSYQMISNKVEPIFKAMNVNAARDLAWGFHYKEFNEVWFGIPCNGATLNNCIVVYNYLAPNGGAWTKYEGIDASTVVLAQAQLDKKNAFYGGYHGNIGSFGSTFYGDSGAGITCMFDSRFLAQSGQTTERQYRRFYLDLNPVLGITQPITINLRADYGNTVQITRTMYQTPFQSRIDFGLPAKAIQVEMIHASASLPLTINGFTFEGRFQRPV